MGGNTIYHNVNMPLACLSPSNKTLTTITMVAKCQTQNSLLALFDLKYVRETRK